MFPTSIRMVLFPLCILKDLSALAFSSIIGMFGTLFTAVVFGVRYFDRSYIPGGRFYERLCVSSRGSFGGRYDEFFCYLFFVLTGD